MSVKLIDSERLSYIYDRLYLKAGEILKKHDPCNFLGGECRASRQSGRESCCEWCAHLSPEGCAVEGLPCKLWLCAFAIKAFPQCAAELSELATAAQEYGLSGYREGKEEIIKRIETIKSLSFLSPVF